MNGLGPKVTATLMDGCLLRGVTEENAKRVSDSAGIRTRVGRKMLLASAHDTPTLLNRLIFLTNFCLITELLSTNFCDTRIRTTKLCGWKHPRAQTVALMFNDERAMRVVLSFLRDTEVGQMVTISLP